jgi:hypothetical protein
MIKLRALPKLRYCDIALDDIYGADRVQPHFSIQRQRQWQRHSQRQRHIQRQSQRQSQRKRLMIDEGRRDPAHHISLQWHYGEETPPI